MLIAVRRDTISIAVGTKLYINRIVKNYNCVDFGAFVKKSKSV